VLDRQESCFRTCVSLHFDGKRLDDFAELHTIEGLQDDSVVKIVEGLLLLFQLFLLIILTVKPDVLLRAILSHNIAILIGRLV
jgi:hypothetical protein